MGEEGERKKERKVACISSLVSVVGALNRFYVQSYPMAAL